MNHQSRAVLVKNIFASAAIVGLMGCASTPAARPGYVEGHVSIGPLTPVERIDTPAPTVPPEFYAAYKIVILRADGRTEVTRADIDAHGNYRVELPPGDYVLDVPRRPGPGGVKDLPKPITIVSDQTRRVDIEIDTGIR